jgi:cytochrome c oxidase subunit III
MQTSVAEEIAAKHGLGAGGGKDSGDNDGPNDPNLPDWPPGFSRDDAVEGAKYRLAMWLGLVSVSMLFVAMTSAYVLRYYTSQSAKVPDWRPLKVPSALWATTAIILLSSITIELARRALRHNRYQLFRSLLIATALLGGVFIIGQLIGWQQLVAQGVYLYSNPHSSFFYILTALHGIHLLGGLLALAYVTIPALRLRITMKSRHTMEITTTYWHFLDGLWVYLFGLLFLF